MKAPSPEETLEPPFPSPAPDSGTASLRLKSWGQNPAPLEGRRGQGGLADFLEEEKTVISPVDQGWHIQTDTHEEVGPAPGRRGLEVERQHVAE